MTIDRDQPGKGLCAGIASIVQKDPANMYVYILASLIGVTAGLRVYGAGRTQPTQPRLAANGCLFDQGS
jgi:hypothetical protein